MFHANSDASGDVMHYKASLVTKGFAPVQGVNFDETFTFVAKFTTIQYILAIWATIESKMQQIDV